MEYGKPIAPDSHTVDFTDATLTAFDNTAAVPASLRRKYLDVEYEAYINIYALATYSWNNFDSNTVGVTTVLADKTTVDSTLVPCTTNVTIVYVIDSYKDTAVPQNTVGKYFKFIGTTGDIDFTIIPTTGSTDWEEVINFRYIDVIPSANSIYWKTIGVVNTKRLLDGKIFTQTEAPISTMVHKFYLSQSTNAIAIFNMECDTVGIIVNAWDGTAYTNEVHNVTINLLDVSGLTSSYAWHYTAVDRYVSRILERIPNYPKIEVIITFAKTAVNPKVGEVIFTRAESSGTTLDKPKGTKRTFDITSQDKSGNRTVIKSDKIIDTISFRVSIETNSINSMIQKWGQLINENILIIGDETGTFSLLFNYAYIKEIPYEISSNSSKNTYQITVNTLI